MTYFRTFAPVLLVTFLSMQPVKASSVLSGDHLREYFNYRINQIWNCSQGDFRPGEYVEVLVHVAGDGKIYDPAFNKLDINLQTNAECAEAVYSLSPISERLVTPTAHMASVSVRFGNESKLTPRFRRPEAMNFIPNQSTQTGIFVIVHKLPLSLLILKPGMFTEDELFSSNNLLPVRVTDDDLDIDTNSDLPKTPHYIDTIANWYAKISPVINDVSATKDDIVRAVNKAVDDKAE